ncbi:hypothetical protein NJL88_31700 [Streptomyces sp. DK15]|uniref:hypothetical protein n=1 Tax=Streptomyces sp. DK15 TaxID=2957499 RepID=UPI0029AF2EC2|nr:hypothetical protein [Streptomyces sp. DK15]MDX2394554.1 hypothetical protein [Streptomyces sp. DK15]
MSGVGNRAQAADDPAAAAAFGVLERLRAVRWPGEWDFAFGHVKSRRVLFREYLRRAAVRCRAHGCEDGWPFVDVTAHLDPAFRSAVEVSGELAEFLRRLPGREVARTCSGAVRWAEFRERNPAGSDGLPDPYEPLLRFYERGGEFARDDAGSIDLTGVTFRLGTLEAYLGNPPVTVLGDTVLDALDTDGRVTYYTSAEDRGLLLRRCVLRGAHTDRSFGRDLRWEVTDRIPDAPGEEVPQDAGLVRLDELAAARLIGRIVTASPGGAGEAP